MQIRDQSVPLALPAIPRFSYENVSFSRQILIASATLLGLAMVIVGLWLGVEVERSTVNRVAAVSAAYVESILAAQLRDTPANARTIDAIHDALDHIFIDGPLRHKIVGFKVWDADGVVHYSDDHADIGRQFPVDGSLAAAFGGAMQARIDDFVTTGRPVEREGGQRLLEVYVPVRMGNLDTVAVVAQFYHRTGSIDREVSAAKLRSWVLVFFGTLAVYLLLVGMVRRANNTILKQRNDLQQQVQQLHAAFKENEHMRQRLGEAGVATTALNEQFLHRVAADLHDGPAQALAFSLMRFDELSKTCDDDACTDGVCSPEFFVIRGALRASLDELRTIAAGLGVPGIAELSLSETARRAVSDSERRFAHKVSAEIDDALGPAALAIKITVYRLLQESLANSARHTPGGAPQVRVWREADQVCVEIADQGAGFDPQAAARSGQLGLAFMQERVRLLGGLFELDTAPGRGTCIRARLPLMVEESEGEQVDPHPFG